MEINYATLIGRRLNRIEKEYTKSTAEKLSDYNWSEAAADILGRIDDSPGMSQNELSEKLLVTKGNPAQLVKKRESCSLIYREQIGRTKHLYLTDTGLYYIGMGESHKEYFTTQGHTVILGAIAQATKQIKLGSSSTSSVHLTRTRFGF